MRIPRAGFAHGRFRAFFTVGRFQKMFVIYDGMRLMKFSRCRRPSSFVNGSRAIIYFHLQSTGVSSSRYSSRPADDYNIRDWMFRLLKRIRVMRYEYPSDVFFFYSSNCFLMLIRFNQYHKMYTFSWIMHF